MVNLRGMYCITRQVCIAMSIMISLHPGQTDGRVERNQAEPNLCAVCTVVDGALSAWIAFGLCIVVIVLYILGKIAS